MQNQYKLNSGQVAGKRGFVSVDCWSPCVVLAGGWLHFTTLRISRSFFVGGVILVLTKLFLQQRVGLVSAGHVSEGIPTC